MWSIVLLKMESNWKSIRYRTKILSVSKKALLQPNVTPNCNSISNHFVENSKVWLEENEICFWNSNWNNLEVNFMQNLWEQIYRNGIHYEEFPYCWRQLRNLHVLWFVKGRINLNQNRDILCKRSPFANKQDS